MAITGEKLAAGKAFFDRMVKYYESQGIRNFDTQDLGDGDLEMDFTYTGDDFPMDFRFIVDSERSFLTVLSSQPLTFTAEQITPAARIICGINNKLAVGCFDLDIEKGRVFWRLSMPFENSLISDETLDDVILLSMKTVDQYNDKLLMFPKGLLTEEAFLKDIGYGKKE